MPFLRRQKKSESGELRTFGSLDSHLENFEESGGHMKIAKNFKNFIRKRLIYKDQDPRDSILDFVSPPPRHLYMGVVNLLCNLMQDFWPGF